MPEGKAFYDRKTRKSLELIFQSEPDFGLLAQYEKRQGAMVPHSHGFCECVFVIRGHGMHQSEDHEPVPFERGCVIVIPKGGRHAHPRVSPDLSILNLMFEVTRLPPILSELYTQPVFKKIFLRSAASYEGENYPMTKLKENVFRELETLLRPLAEAGEKKGDHTFKLGLFMAVMSRLCSVWEPSAEETASSPDIPKLIAYMERNFCEEIYLEDLEKLSSMSRSTLQRRFRSVTGVPPMVYLNRIRLRRAAELLLNTDFSIKEIADQSGFFRTPYFFQSFRDCYGVTPQEYRSSRRLPQKERGKS